MGSVKKIKNILDMIKFEHTIFALPFAYLGMVLGAGGLPPFYTFLWITLAMVGARSYAMALNRLFDLNFDKKNPRTSDWSLSKGLVTVKETIVLALVSLAVFFISVFMLPSLCYKLWPFVLLPMTFYSLAKRFTCLSHLFLGFCLGLAPLGAWVAVTNTMPPPGIWSLGLAVLFWTAGFDIIYSCQDYHFDKNEGLHSIPVRFGLKKALGFSKFFHVLTIFFLVLLGKSFSLSPVFYIGIILIALFLWYENSIVTAEDLSRINVSFFTLNGFVSIFTFVFTFISILE
jgi:4-hydroxybenzoate polyprenyltransferase